MLKTIILTLFFLISCGGPEKGLKSEIDSENDLIFSKECPRVVLGHEIIVKDNLKNLFICTGWNLEYKKIFSVINDLPDEYDFIAKRLGQQYFKGDNNRNKFISIVSDSISQNNSAQKLGDYFKYLSMDKNINIDLDKLIGSDFFDKIIFEPEILENLFLLFTSFVNQVSQSGQGLEKLHIGDSIKEKRDSFYLSFLKSLNEEAFRKSLIKLSSDEGWPVNWLSSVGPDELNDLLDALSEKFNQFNDSPLRVLDTMNIDLVCSSEMGTYEFNHVDEVEGVLRELRDNELTSAIPKYLALLQKFSFFKNACGELVNIPYRADLFISDAAGLLGFAQKAIFVANGSMLVQQILKSLPVSMQEELSLNILKTLGSDTLNNYFRYINEIKNNDVNKPGLLSWLKLIKKFDVSFFNRLSTLVESIDNNDLALAINDYILSLPTNELSSIFNLVTMQYENQAGHEQLVLLETLYDAYPGFFSQLMSSPRDVKLVLQAIAKDINSDLFHEVGQFLKNRELTHILSIVGNSRKVVFEKDGDERSNEFVTPLIMDENEQVCVDWIGNKLRDEIDFWSLLYGYPSQCEQIGKTEFTTQIFSWSARLDRNFFSIFGHSFSERWGMVAPEMIQFYLRIMFLVDKYVDHDGPAYVARVVSKSKNALLEGNLLPLIDNGALFANYLDGKLHLLDRLEKKLEIRREFHEIDKVTIEKFWNNFFRINIPENFTNNCLSIWRLPGEARCLSKQDSTLVARNLSRFLVRNNEENKNFINEFIDYIYGHSDIAGDGTSIKELVLFLVDINKENTRSEVNVRRNNYDKVINLKLSERLELMLREIGFLNNYYGSYFLNALSERDNYLRTVSKMRKRLVMMDLADGFFRRRRGFPFDANDRFKNMRQVYNSLIEVDGPFAQLDGSENRYGHLMHGLIKILVGTSKINSQDFSPFRSANIDIANGHNSILLLIAANNSLLTKSGQLFKNVSSGQNYQKLVKSLSGLEKILKKISKNKLKSFVHKFLNHKNRDVIFNDMYDVFVNSSNADRSISFLISSMKFISKVENEKSLDVLINILSYFLDNYSQLSTVIKEIDKEKWNIILKYLENILVHYENNNINITNIIDWLSENDLKIKQLLVDPEFYNHGLKIADGINKIDEIAVYELFDLIRKITSDSAFTFSPVFNLLTHLNTQEFKPKYITNMLRFMLINDNSHSKIYWGLLELFDDNEIQLRNFLSDIFLKIHLLNP